MNIREVLKRFRVPFQEGGDHRHVRPGWIGVDCPWCGKGSGKFHLGINVANLYTSCWRCGSHSMLAVLVEATGLEYRDCYQLLQGIDKIKLPKSNVKVRGTLKIPKSVKPLQKPHKAYLSSRGFDPTYLTSLWHLCGISLDSWLAWRIFIPVKFQGNTVSWTTRSISDTSKQRYINAPPTDEAIAIKSIVYGWDYVHHAVVVTEGPADVWRLGPGCVATLGLQTTPEQIELLARVPVRAICFDNESGAKRRARKLTEMLSVLPGKTMLIELDSPDLGEASEKEIRAIRKAVFQ